MFLDYDGTLSPIVADPDQAFISKEVHLLHLCSSALYMFISHTSPVHYLKQEFLKSDESRCQGCRQIFPNCHSKREMQRQGTFFDSPLFLKDFLISFKIFTLFSLVNDSILQVHRFVKLSELYYAGSHGMDIKGPAKARKHNKVSTIIITDWKPYFLFLSIPFSFS